MNFLLGVVVGIVLATIGFSGVVNGVDKAVTETVKVVKSVAK